MRKISKTTLIYLCVMFVAIVLLTWLTRVPYQVMRGAQNAQAYFNMGDLGVMAAAALLGGPWAALCSALASALGDIIVGSSIYALPTLVIKALMAFVTAFMLRRDSTWLGLVRTVAYSGMVMVAGYFIYDLLILGDYATAALCLPLNVLQLLANGLVAIPVLKLLHVRIKKKDDFFEDSKKKRRVV